MNGFSPDEDEQVKVSTAALASKVHMKKSCIELFCVKQNLRFGLVWADWVQLRVDNFLYL